MGEGEGGLRKFEKKGGGVGNRERRGGGVRNPLPTKLKLLTLMARKSS